MAVTTDAATNVTYDSADLNGEHTESGVLERAFIYDTVSRAKPEAPVISPSLVGSIQTQFFDEDDPWVFNVTNPVGGDVILIGLVYWTSYSFTIDYGGVTPDLIDSNTDESDQPIYWYKIDAVDQPAEGDPHDITVDFSATFGAQTSGYLVFLKLDNAEDLVNILSAKSLLGSGDTNIVTVINSVPEGSFVIDIADCEDQESMTVGSGQTEVINDNSSTSETFLCSYKENVSAGNITMEWTGDIGDDTSHLVIAIPGVTGDVPAPGDTDYADNITETAGAPYSAGTFSLNASGLPEGTTHYVRAGRKDSSGDWDYGNEVNFTTEETMFATGSATFTGSASLGKIVGLAGAGGLEAEGEGSLPNVVDIDAAGGMTGEGEGEIGNIIEITASGKSSFSGAANIEYAVFSRVFANQVTDSSIDGTNKVILQVNTDSMPSGALPAGQYEDLIINSPVVQESTNDELFGISGLRSTTVVLSNYNGKLSGIDFTRAYVRLIQIVDEQKTLISGQVNDWDFGFEIELRIKDIEAVALEEDIPKRDINVTDFPNATDLGERRRIIFGKFHRARCWYIHADDANRNYDFLVGEGVGYNGGYFKSLAAVYREDSVLLDVEGDVQDSGSYWIEIETQDRQADEFYKFQWVEITSGTGAGQFFPVYSYISTGEDNGGRIYIGNESLSSIDFWDTQPNITSNYRLRAWRFFDGSQGSPYPGNAFIRFKKRLGSGNSFDNIYADGEGFEEEENFVRAVQSWLENATWGLGLSVDTDSFDTAAALSGITALECGGTFEGKKTARNVINELLSVRGMRLTQTESGLSISVDQAKTPAATFGILREQGDTNILNASDFRENRGDASLVTKTLKISFRKDFKKNTWLEYIERDANPEGVLTEIFYNYIYDINTADRVADYRRKRLISFARQATLRCGFDAAGVLRGDAIKLEIPALIINSNYEVISAPKEATLNSSLVIMPYNADTYTYEAKAGLPDNPDQDIFTNFEETPPSPVSGLSVSKRVETASDGTLISIIQLSWTPPEENYSGSRILMRLSSETDNDFRETASGINNTYDFVGTAGLGYYFLVVPYNEAGRKPGLPSETGLVVADGDSTAPANVSGLTVDKREHGSVTWKWNKPSEGDFRRTNYRLWTSSGGGSMVDSGDTTDNKITLQLKDSGSLASTLTRYLELQHEDLSGNKSNSGGWSSRVAGTTKSVETDDITNNDITVKGSFSNNSNTTGSTVASVSVNLSGSYPVQISFRGVMASAAGLILSISDGSSTIHQDVAPGAYSGTCSISFQDSSPPSGFTTYTITAGNNPGIANRQMFVTELKR